MTEETACEVSASGTSAPKISVVPVGRILMDGAMYTSDEKDLFPDGVAIPELRLGAKATTGEASTRTTACASDISSISSVCRALPGLR